MIDKAFCNVFHVTFCFLFYMTSYITISNTQKYLLESIKKDHNDYNADGYIGLCIVYFFTAFANWLAPSVIMGLGPRMTLFTGMLINTLYVLQFLSNIDILFYIASAFCGVASAFVWSSEANYMILNSDENTVARNSAIFWGTIQLGEVIGNMYMLFVVKSDTISEQQRDMLFYVMIGISGLGTLLTVTLRKPVYEGEKLEPLNAFVRATKLFITRDMLLISVTSFYSGLEMSFYVGVYTSAMGFTNKLDEKSTTLVAMSGILIGVGEVVGGLIFGFLGNKVLSRGKYPIVIFGTLIQIIAFTITFINLPNSSTDGPSDDNAVIASSVSLGYLCAFLLGFGDCCIITQIYGIIGSVYAKESASAFPIYTFVQCFAAAIGFFYTPIKLYGILIILYIFAVFGVVSFCLVELRPTYRPSVSTADLVENTEQEPSPVESGYCEPTDK